VEAARNRLGLILMTMLRKTASCVLASAKNSRRPPAVHASARSIADRISLR
jgi:hypothetical protein